MSPKKGEEEHVVLDLHSLDDDYFDAKTPITQVLSKIRSGPFAPGSLSILHPVPLHVELERAFGGAFYIGLHFVPAALGLAALNFFSFALPGSNATYTNGVVAGFSAYMISLYAAWRFVSLQQGEYLSKGNPDQITMRNNEKFYSMKAVWPKGAGPEEMRDCPAIYCMVPHGAVETLTPYPENPTWGGKPRKPWYRTRQNHKPLSDRVPHTHSAASSNPHVSVALISLRARTLPSTKACCPSRAGSHSLGKCGAAPVVLAGSRRRRSSTSPSFPGSFVGQT